ncbi:MAG TPA: pilus assembly protein N-terminal domain-containing protein, partial [Alphaproteobacteria bacterium]
MTSFTAHARTLLRGIGIVVLAATLALAPLAAQAAQPAAMVVATKATVINIEVNKGRLVRLDQPVTSVFLADPAIADVQVKSPTLVYVFGKKAG